MSISQKEVEHIAHLARIELTDMEKEKLSSELSAILSFIEQLNSVATDNVLPMSGGTLLENVVRLDDPEIAQIESISPLESVPDTEKGYVKVKAIFQ